MKKILSISLFVCAVSTVAQDTYMNEQTLNTSEDVIGTSRFVGMGGAMGALGADMSVIGWNPAGIGMFRKSDFSLTFGGLWNKSAIEEESRGTGTFDQVGIVFNFRTESDVCPYVNFGFNYQKKKNFFSNFYADNADLLGLSQMDQLYELAKSYNYAGYAPKDVLNLIGNIAYNGIMPNYYDEQGKRHYNGDFNEYTHHSAGALRGWDFNVSTNINNRFFLGLTFGLDNIDYESWTKYYEQDHHSVPGETNPVHDGYSVATESHITGYGFNFKFGGIVCPIEDNPFRLGFVVETPTWFKLKSFVNLGHVYEANNSRTFSEVDEIDLHYNPFTPWKFRASMGSTVGGKFAWDIDYEFANYKSMTQRYPDTYSSYSGTKDAGMNEHTRNTLKGVHTIRAGMEVRPVSPLAFRLGYNFITSAYNNDANFDQVAIISKAIDFIPRTNYMVKKPTHILTLGMGYKWKHFYFDLAYKIRHQKADFYAFDDSFTTPGTDYSVENPNMENVRLAPVPVDLTRHSISCTLGLKF
jgi:hypothetical protein